MAKITYYDFSDIDYASLFVEGFLQLHDQKEIQFEVKKSIPDELEGLELPTWITYRKPTSTTIFRYENQANDFLFCIDSNDHNGLDPDLPAIYPGYHLHLIERVKYYFKVNYSEEAITANPEVAAFVDKIFPLPLVYPLRVSKARLLLPSLTRLSGQRWPMSAVKRRLKHMRPLLSLSQYRQLRQIPRDLDVFFVTAIYSNKEHDDINNWRLELLQALDACPHLNTLMGCVNLSGELGKKYEKYKLPPMPFKTYITQLARSKIGLYTRGTYGCVSFKFGQYFALGKPIVGEPLINNRKNMYAYDNFIEQFKYVEPQEFADRIVELIADPIKLKQLGDINTATFENHFTPEAVTRSLLKQIKEEQNAS